jgi:hypothetical protein
MPSSSHPNHSVLPLPPVVQDIDWVFLTNIAEGGVGGDLADGAYTADTKLGRPLVSSCMPGSEPIEVRCAGEYCELDIKIFLFFFIPL